MIQISNLHKAYGQQVIFDDVTFTINKGERVGLVGRNGHGKTTLFRLILEEEHPDSGTISTPYYYRIGHLNQHISFSEDTILDEACAGTPSTDDYDEQTYKAEKILMGLGFSTDDFSRHPSELSGGYQIRLNIAKLLASEPNLLLLDEPTNYLDIVSIRWLAKFLRSWKNELILITHDRSFMDSVTTHTMGIHRSRLRKIEGPTQKLYDLIILEEEIYEKTRINDEKKRKEIELFINRFRAKATKARTVQSRIKVLDKKERLERIQEIKNLDFEFNSAPFCSKVMLDAQGIFFSFKDNSPLIKNLDLTVYSNDRIGIIGKNGKGKTTLLNILSGHLMPAKGNIEKHPALKEAYFGQMNIERLNPAKTVEEEIIEVHPENNKKASRNICGLMMFEGDNALKKISVLSGGEKSRVLLGKILVSPANLLLLDEPTNHLDMESVDSLLEAIDAFKGAVIIVTHSEMILHAIANRLVVFDNGEVSVFEGTYQDFLQRVGWKDEAEVIPKNSYDNKGLNKKDLRRIRADIINERSRTIVPMQKRISEIEELIVSLEKEIEDSTSNLLKASEKGDWQACLHFSQSINNSKEQIENLFEELATLTEKLDIKSRDFEKRLAEANA